MKLVIGADHGGYELKEDLKGYLTENGYEVEDVGTFSTASCDYPDIAKAACAKIQSGEYERGILICGTGVGISMAANKCKGIRAACCSDTFTARYTMMHNDANVLCFGGRVVGAGLARELVDAYLGETFQGGRHKIRVDKIMAIEAGTL